ELAHRRSRLLEAVVAGEDVGEDVVAEHGGDAHRPDAELARDRRGAAGGGERVRRAHVGDDAHAPLDRRAEDTAHPRLEQRIEAGVRLAAACLLRERDRALGEALEDEDVEVAALDELERGLDAIARVAGAGAEAKRAPRRRPPAVPVRSHVAHDGDALPATGLAGGRRSAGSRSDSLCGGVSIQASISVYDTARITGPTKMPTRPKPSSPPITPAKIRSSGRSAPRLISTGRSTLSSAPTTIVQTTMKM